MKKLRIRFVCIVMAIVTVMMCVIFGLVIHFTGRSLEAQSLRMMQTVAPAPGRPGMNDRDEVRLPYFSILVDRSGLVVGTGGYEGLIEEGDIPQIVQEVLASEGQTGILRDFELRFWKGGGIGGDRPGFSGEMIVLADISVEKATMKNLVKTCAAIGTMALLVFWGISVLLARWAVKPVEQAWQQQKQFVADASHELKTPLTVIMTSAELLQSQGQNQFADSILTMSRQMRGLVEGMLELARVDNGAVQTSFSELDMSGLVTDALLPFEPLYFEKELVLSAAIPEGIRVKGSASHLKQVLDILLDNAMKYSVPQGEVRVKLARHGSHALLSVASPGEAVSREDLENIFKRFYRVDKARSRDGSYGLGLSIAQRIVQEHKGRIWAESAEGVNTFFVQLPVG